MSNVPSPQGRSANPIGRRAFLNASAGLAAAGLAGASATTASSQPARPSADMRSASQRKLGTLQVSPIGLGCMSMAPGFYNPAPAPADMVRVIRGAHDLGVTFFDTAEVYGPFISETILGEAVRPIRDRVTIATKFGFAFEGSKSTGRNSRPDHIRRAVEGSLRRLATDRIDLLYLHRMDPQVPIADIAGTVGELIRAGKVRQFGVSEVNVETLRAAHAVTPVAAVQSEYSIFERLPEVAMLDACEQLGIGFVPWGPTMRAMLADDMNAYTRFAAEDRRAAVPFFTPEALAINMDVVGLVRRWSDRKGVSPVQFALAWLLAQRPFIVPIPGSTKLHHIRENLGANDVRLTAQELAAFRKELEAMPIVGNRPRSAAAENQ